MFLNRKVIKRIPWTQLFIEAVLVVLSVLLALALNSWRQSEINEDLATQSLRNFESEIRTNKAEVEEALSYHEMLIDTLQSGKPAQGIALKTAFIRDNAWETAQATQAVTYLNYDIVYQVSEVHDLQETYKRITYGVVQTLYMTTNTGRGQAQLAMLYDLRDLEQLLLQSYEKLLAMIEA